MIKIYTLPDCKLCKEAKNYFKSKNIDYEEVNMSIGGNKKTIEMKKEFKRMGLKAYPVIFVKTKEEELIIPEFDEDVMDEILKDYGK